MMRVRRNGQAHFQCLGKWSIGLDGLPHSPHFADESRFSSLGHLLHDLINEGKRVAEAVGVQLHEDPWEMNKIGAMTNHPPSMLYDIRHQLPTEVDFLSGAIAREAERVGIRRADAYCGLPPN